MNSLKKSTKIHLFTLIIFLVAVSLLVLFAKGYRVSISVNMTDRWASFDKSLVDIIRSNPQKEQVVIMLQGEPKFFSQEFDGSWHAVNEAIFIDRPDLVEILIEHGADYMLMGPSWIGGWTAFEYAIVLERYKCLEMILETSHDLSLAKAVYDFSDKEQNSFAKSIALKYLNQFEP